VRLPLGRNSGQLQPCPPSTPSIWRAVWEVVAFIATWAILVSRLFWRLGITPRGMLVPGTPGKLARSTGSRTSWVMAVVRHNSVRKASPEP
jgi:hypothetical protein